jgi:hypothetical protein
MTTVMTEQTPFQRSMGLQALHNLHHDTLSNGSNFTAFTKSAKAKDGNRYEEMSLAVDHMLEVPLTHPLTHSLIHSLIRCAS